MGQIDEDRRRERGEYIIPVLLHDAETEVYIRGVIVDLSGSGCRVFTNDRRVRLVEEKHLVGRTFRLEFDFYEFETRGVEGRIVNVAPGEDRERQRELGIQFTKIPLLLKRDINRMVLRDQEERRRKTPHPGPRRERAD